MYAPRKNRIIIDGEDKTDSVERCWYTSRPNRCHVIFCNFPRTYSYVPSKVLWLKDPMVFDPQHCHLLDVYKRQVQGLELDYTCVLWDADLRCENGSWRYFNFNGRTAWREEAGQTESSLERRKYMLNAYRVLLTRARIGMVICVPEGNSNKTVDGFPEDATRLPEFYNGTYKYLKSIGLEEI